MADNTLPQVRELVADFKLNEALELLITQAQSQNQRKQNALLVLKGKLALLDEQNLAGMLEHDEVLRQKAAIAHQILDIADGSSLDEALPGVKPPADTAAGDRKRLLFVVASLALVVLAYFLIRWVDNRLAGNETPANPAQEQSEQQPAEDVNPSTNNPSGAPLKVLDFPNLKKPFNFLDFGIEFARADAEWISDSEIKLNIRYAMTCKSNFGVCYRAILLVYANGQAISPIEQSNLAGWLDMKDTATNDVTFILPANTSDFMIEFSRDHSTWKRPFKILH